jgi:hypothetical protein
MFGRLDEETSKIIKAELAPKLCLDFIQRHGWRQGSERRLLSLNPLAFLKAMSRTENLYPGKPPSPKP